MARTRKPKYQNYEEVTKKLEGVVPDEVENQEHHGGSSVFLKRTLQIRTTPIVIGIPMDELMFSQFLSNLVCLSIMPWDSFITTASTLVQEARNIIHDSFIEKSTAPYLFMLDSDVLPPPDTIERLLKHDKPVVGGYYRKKEKFRIKQLDGIESVIQRPVVYDFKNYDDKNGKYMYTQRLNEGVGLERVDGMGAGCWLIKREVIEAIGKSPYNFDGSGEDLCFCRAVYDAGYEVFVDWSIACAHAGVMFI